MAAETALLFSAFSTAAGVAVSAQEKKKASKVAKRADEEKAQLLKEESVLQERDRQDRLKTALSSQKALFGARGISSRSGSALSLATKAIADSRASKALNATGNAYKLNQLNRGSGFSTARQLLGSSNSLIGAARNGYDGWKSFK